MPYSLGDVPYSVNDLPIPGGLVSLAQPVPKAIVMFAGLAVLLLCLEHLPAEILVLPLGKGLAIKAGELVLLVLYDLL